MSRLSAEAKRTQEEAEEDDVLVDGEDEYDESDVEFNLESDVEKDEIEEELEHLVFGDSAGFRENLRSFPQEDAADNAEDHATTGLEGLEDAEVG